MISRSPSPEFSPLAIGEDFAPLPTYKTATTTSVNFSGLLERPLKLQEDLKSGCGGQLWPAGIVLAQHILRYHRNSLKDARMSAFSILFVLGFFADQHVVSNLELVVGLSV
jgi:protein N-lysine methyltransferase METTL21A